MCLLPKPLGHTAWSPSVAKAGRVRPACPVRAWLLTHLGAAASVIEHLVAEVVRLGFAVVLPGHVLVACDDQGGCPRRQGEDGHHDEDDRAGRQPWLRARRLTWRGRDGHEVGGLPKAGGARLRGLVPPEGPALGRHCEGGMEGSGSSPDGACSPLVAAGCDSAEALGQGGVRPRPCGPLKVARRESQAWEAQHPGQLSLPTFWASTGQEEATWERQVPRPVGLPMGRHAGPTRSAAWRSAGSPRPGGDGDTGARGPRGRTTGTRVTLAQPRSRQHHSQQPRRKRPVSIRRGLDTNRYNVAHSCCRGTAGPDALQTGETTT